MRLAPITAFVGANGSGKTMSAIAYAHRAKGRRVVTNVSGTIFDQFTDVADLAGNIRNTDIVFDEAGVLFSSRSPSRDVEFLGLVQQLRKYNARLFWTAPAYSRADKILREVTQMVVKCRPVLKHRIADSVWPSPRIVVNLAFDANDFDAFGQRITDKAKRAGIGWLYTNKHVRLFDSFALVGQGDARGGALAVPRHALGAETDRPAKGGKPPSL